MAMEVTFSRFEDYIGTPYETYIHPIIPVGSTMSALSKITPDRLGKIPGRMKPDGTWAGYNWQAEWQYTKATTLRRYQAWQLEGVPKVIPIGLVTREYIAIDLDTEDEKVVEWFKAKIAAILGVTPVIRRRDGNKTRMVLFFKHKNHTPPITKHKFEALDADGNKHLLEIVGSGEQVVIEGPHAKGAMQYWENGGLVDHIGELPEIDLFMCDELINTLKAEAESQGLTEAKISAGHMGGNSEAHSIGNLVSPLIEKNVDRLTRAIQHIDLDDPRIDYDVFITLLRAICAAVSGDKTYMAEVVWPWACTQSVRKGQGPLTRDQEGGIAWIEERWVSFRDSQVGPDTIYSWAARCGYYEAGNEAAAEKGEGVFDALPDEGDDDGSGVLGGAVGGGSGGAGGSGSNGPLPFAFTDNAVADTFAALHPEWRYTPDQDWVIYKGGVYVPSDMVLADISDVCVAVGAPFRAQGPTQAAIDMTLNGIKKHLLVERKLRCHRAVHAKPADFDADPWMLNTPDFIVDLRTGEFHEHAGQLMRQQTLVSPSCMYGCPRFMEYLDFIANGRDYVIPFLQRWGAYSLIGDIFDQLLLFILGVPGSGKSTFADILARISHTYGKPVSKGFFMRQMEKRTFELYQTRGKRGLFADETPKGATWDEILINSMLGGTMLSAEGKGRDFIDFRNVGTITVTGNHKPAFITHSEESGIGRRLLLLELKKKIADHMPDNTRFPVEVVQEEGAAILMWLVQGAMEGWQSLQSTGSFIGGLEKPLSQQTRKYRLDANPYLEWIKAEMSFDPEGDIDANDAIGLYRAYEQVEYKPKHPERREAFRSGIIALGNLIGRPIIYERRTAGSLKGRYAFKGIRRRSDADNGLDPNAKIVDIFTGEGFRP
jgi:putative DNA primase/helicase